MIKGARFTEADAEAHVHGICFKTGPPERVGVELEWLARDRRDPALPVQAEQVTATLAGFGPEGHSDGEGYPGQTAQIVRYEFPSLPSGASLTVEPGGQLELSSAPAATLGELVEVTGRDLASLRDAAAAAGLELCGYGLDPLRPPRRLLDLPRYAAMEKFFDRQGPWGRQMMCGTASVQVCLDAGDDSAGQSGYRSRWRLLHAIGPVLVAAFANSPLRDGKPTDWRSARQQVWANMDPGRTRAPALHAAGKGVGEAGGDPRDACAEDLDYHLSTLFPPVRPRGHMELRMIDAQPGDGWIVPAAVVTALADNDQAADAALAAAEPLWNGPLWSGSPDAEGLWLRAARCGPADPLISQASKRCFEAAGGALVRLGVPAAIRQAVADFTERYVQKDRCPADDQLDGI